MLIYSNYMSEKKIAMRMFHLSYSFQQIFFELAPRKVNQVIIIDRFLGLIDHQLSERSVQSE